MLSRLMKKQDGFTLIELLVVVVIIGVLVGIAVPIYNNIQTTAQETRNDANARILNSSWLLYQVEQEIGDGTTPDWPGGYVDGATQAGGDDEDDIVIEGVTFSFEDGTWGH